MFPLRLPISYIKYSLPPQFSFQCSPEPSSCSAWSRTQLWPEQGCSESCQCGSLRRRDLSAVGCWFQALCQSVPEPNWFVFLSWTALRSRWNAVCQRSWGIRPFPCLSDRGSRISFCPPPQSSYLQGFRQDPLIFFHRYRCFFWLLLFWVGNEIPLFHVGDGGVILLHSSQDAISRFRNTQVCLIELNFIISLLDF